MNGPGGDIGFSNQVSNVGKNLCNEERESTYCWKNNPSKGAENDNIRSLLGFWSQTW